MASSYEETAVTLQLAPELPDTLLAHGLVATGKDTGT